MPKKIYVKNTINLPRNSLAKNINTKHEKKKEEEKKTLVNMKQKAFLKMLPVLAGLHNTASAADRLLPNITMGKKGEFAQYDPSSPFRANIPFKIKHVHNQPANKTQKTTKKNKHRGGRKYKNTRKHKTTRK